MYEEPYNIEFNYHNYEQMSRFLRATSLRFQNLTALYSIGKSVQGIRLVFPNMRNNSNHANESESGDRYTQ